MSSPRRARPSCTCGPDAPDRLPRCSPLPASRRRPHSRHQPAPTAADAAARPFLTGRWEGTGTILGQPARAEMEWTPVLAGRFVAAHLGEPHRRRRQRPSGSRAIAYYQATATGVSRDVVRLQRHGAADSPPSVDGDAIVAAWGTPRDRAGRDHLSRRRSADAARGGGPRARQERRMARVRPHRRCAALP